MRELNSQSHEASAAQLEVALEVTFESPTVVVNKFLTDIFQSRPVVNPDIFALRKIIYRKHNSVMNAHLC